MGRRLANAFRVTINAAGATQILGPNPNRIALLLCCSNEDHYAFSFKDAPTFDTGLKMFQRGNPVLFRGEDYGCLLKEPIQAISQANNSNVNGIEIIAVGDIS